MTSAILVQASAFVAFFLYGSFFEWALHKWALHRRLPGLAYAYRTHQLEHHVQYKGDDTYEASDPGVEDHGRFKAWDYLYLMLFNLPIMLAIGWLIGIYIAPTCAVATLTYTFCFDFLHGIPIASCACFTVKLLPLPVTWT